MRYELINKEFGTPINSMDGTELTGKMFINTILTIKDTETKNPNNVWNESLVVEFEKTLSVNEIEELLITSIASFMVNLNK